MPTNWTGLMPQGVADSVLSAAQEQSAVLSLATVRPMPAGVEHLPLVSVAPQAASIATGARKTLQRDRMVLQTDHRGGNRLHHLRCGRLHR